VADQQGADVALAGSELSTRFDELWESLLTVGRSSATGGYHRLPWTKTDLECRAWFERQAEASGLGYELDRNGNQWAWWGDSVAPEVVATGSHLDSVPDGGAYDGALGVASAFAARDLLQARGLEPKRPLAVVSFVEEEGSRFGHACVGSRLMTGVLDPAAAFALRDADDVALPEAVRHAGYSPSQFGPDRERLRRLRAFVEVHIEQGRSLVREDAPVGVAREIWPHGRYRFDFRGEANHAGTTLLGDRKDPTIPFAHALLAAREAASRRGGLATFGRFRVEPNATNAIPSLVQAWLDARAPDETRLRAIIDETATAAGVDPAIEGLTPAVEFDPELRALLSDELGAPLLSSAAGHDPAVLASAGVPAAMIFVRNRTGLSHAPGENADRAACLAGVDALARILERLACR
jgi:N-carbamoyl-L-amino-acid hydrolase